MSSLENINREQFSAVAEIYCQQSTEDVVLCLVWPISFWDPESLNRLTGMVIEHQKHYNIQSWDFLSIKWRTKTCTKAPDLFQINTNLQQFVQPQHANAEPKDKHYSCLTCSGEDCSIIKPIPHDSKIPAKLIISSTSSVTSFVMYRWMRA